uniref:Protein SON n=1 Tax=Rhabditophanes sp. KR3021 TaxID=114890 RepID=A0AC35U984_9BILA
MTDLKNSTGSDDGIDNILSDTSDDLEMLRKEKKRKERRDKEKDQYRKDKPASRKRKRSKSPLQDRPKFHESRRVKKSKSVSDEEYIKTKKKRSPSEEEDHCARKAARREKRRLRKEKKSKKEDERKRSSTKDKKRSRSRSSTLSYSSSPTRERHEPTFHPRPGTFMAKMTSKQSDSAFTNNLSNANASNSNKKRALVTAYTVEAKNGVRFNPKDCEWLRDMNNAHPRKKKWFNSNKNNNHRNNTYPYNKEPSPPRESIDKDAIRERAMLNAAKMAMKGELRKEDILPFTGGKSLESFIEQASSQMMTSLGPLAISKPSGSKKNVSDGDLAVEAISDDSEDEETKWGKIEKTKPKTAEVEEEDHEPQSEAKKVVGNSFKFNISNFRALPVKSVQERLLDEHKAKESPKNLLNKWMPVSTNQQGESNSRVKYSVNPNKNLKIQETSTSMDGFDLLPPPPPPPTLSIAVGKKVPDYDLPPPPMPPMVAIQKVVPAADDDFLLPPPPMPPLASSAATTLPPDLSKNPVSLSKIRQMKAEAETRLKMNPFDNEAQHNLKHAEDLLKVWGAKTLSKSFAILKSDPRSSPSTTSSPSIIRSPLMDSTLTDATSSPHTSPTNAGDAIAISGVVV